MFKMSLIPFFFSIVSWFAFTAQADECKHRIVFLPQSHAADKLTGAQTSEDQNTQVAESQLKIANYIERFPNVPVFSEQTAAQNYSLDMIPQDKRLGLQNHFNKIFPQGLPENPNVMTNAQKRKLIDNGGDFVQLIRGRVNLLRKVVEDQNALDKIFDPIKIWLNKNPSRGVAYPPEIGTLVYGERERAALMQVQKYFSLNPKQKDIILIYGSNHSFKFYPDEFPPACVLIPTEFQSDWNGRFRSGPEGFPSSNKVDYSEPTTATR